MTSDIVRDQQESLMSVFAAAVAEKLGRDPAAVLEAFKSVSTEQNILLMKGTDWDLFLANFQRKTEPVEAHVELSRH